MPTVSSRDWLLLLRVKQWVKNGFVLAPLLFALKFTDPAAIAAAAGATFAFCLVSSATYVFNDLRDREQDALHPVKRQRPIAAGRVGARKALTISLLLLAAGFALGCSVGASLVVALGVYALIHVAYSMGLKHVAVLDVMCIAAGFVLRVIGGAEAIQVPFSEWLLLCTFLLACFLGFAKRRQEIILLGTNATAHRAVLLHYSPEMLDQILTLSASSTIIGYALYTISPVTIEKFNTHALIYTVPFVYYALVRYLQLVHKKGKGDDPTEVVYSDVPLVVNGLLWALTCALIVYWSRLKALL